MRALLLPSVLVAITLAGCGGSSKPHGYLDSDRLSKALTEQINAKLNNPTPSQLEDLKASGIEQGDSVDELVCIQSTPSRRKFTCKMKLLSGYTENVSILVSKDGNTYISE